jgi:hypothetical protein
MFKFIWDYDGIEYIKRITVQRPIQEDGLGPIPDVRLTIQVKQ